MYVINEWKKLPFNILTVFSKLNANFLSSILFVCSFDLWKKQCQNSILYLKMYLVYWEHYFGRFNLYLKVCWINLFWHQNSMLGDLFPSKFFFCHKLAYKNWKDKNTKGIYFIFLHTMLIREVCIIINYFRSIIKKNLT